MRSETWERWAVAAMAILLLAPLAVSQHGRFGPPRIYGQGIDEEPYLIVLHSLIADGDLDLRNQHARAAAGGPEAGAQGRGRFIDHHAVFWSGGKIYVWRDIVDRDRSRWHRNAEGLLEPAYRAPLQHLSAQPERSAHQIGGPLLAAIFLWPLRWAPEWVEPAALILAGLFTVLGLLLLWRITFRVTDSPWVRCLIVAAGFLGAPVWYYARTFFNEPLMVGLAVTAVWSVTCRRWEPLAGFCVAWLTSMRATSALLVVPLAWNALQSRDWKRVAWVVAPPALAALGFLALNWSWFGLPWRMPQSMAFTANPLPALWGFLGERDRGLFWFAPPLLLGIAGLVPLWRRTPEVARPAAGAAAAWALPMIFWIVYTGGWCYGPRLLVPILPLLALGIAAAWHAGWLRTFAARFVLYNALLYAIASNGQAVFRYWVTMTYGVPWKIFGDFLGVGVR